MVYTLVPGTPSFDPQRSSLHINNIEARTDINYVIANIEYQALLWDTQWVCLGFLPQVNTVSAEKLNVCTALYISNIRPLKVNSVPYWICNSSDIKNLNNYTLDPPIYEQYSIVTILYREKIHTHLFYCML
jgi:hypothetical protein